MLPDTEFYTVAEVAKEYRVSKMTIYRMIESGELAAIQIGSTGRVFRIPADAVASVVHSIN